MRYLIILDVLLTMLGIKLGYDKGASDVYTNHLAQRECLVGTVVINTPNGFLQIGEQRICGMGLSMSDVRGPKWSTERMD